jgi:hypothetical protein
MADQDEDFEVGFKKPPKATQFKKGRSGNPRGRPKGSRNLATAFIAISREKMSVTERGRRLIMTKGDVILHRMINEAITGDVRARRDYFQIYKMFQAIEVPDEVTPDLSDREAELMQNFITQMQKLGAKEPI